VRISKIAKNSDVNLFISFEDWQSNLFKVQIFALFFLVNTKKLSAFLKKIYLNIKPYSLLGAKFEFFG